ncbi:hypothetical protein BH09ACT1_BH09ACT1_02180 [soil metagenome]
MSSISAVTKLLASAVVLVSVLSGCSSAVPGPAASNSDPSNSDPSNSDPSNSAATDDSATKTSSPAASDPDEWLIDFSGIGPATVGSKLSATGGLIAGLDRDTSANCPNPNAEFFTFDGKPFIAVLTNPSDNDTVAAVTLQYAAGTAGHGPLTAAGVGVGSTESAVAAAYPSTASRDPSGEGILVDYPVAGPNGSYLDVVVSEGTVSAITVWKESGTISEYRG